ncbi:uncharacterized protein A1O9_12418 [Exophiala aquamarina CBS 119918]|uniref:ubiquitinyl hydrolase 1 n=1 Tax=Exophiala aquamarina CBS 119918 TaxID=1182545 RepID=A0A072NV48_9EURO|nr:uncharacterized protein A1O9_12418 [Exophiala aquamarina CBS 119918]KEF51501.1 hypothetical protein A1O9_12418 [Exophiala aquamarina CBS 119918]
MSMKSSIGCLVDNCSSMGQAVCNILRPFEKSEHIVVYISNDKMTGVQIKLPRYHLNFSVLCNGDLKCKELAAVVDRSQSIGTLHGLKSLLVLRPVTTPLERNERIVLIPHGNVEYFPASPHVEVRIELGTNETLLFSKYRLDGRLGQLISDDLEGHLFKTFLHAVTSFPERDSFTSRTGSEEVILGLSDHVTLTSIPLSTRSQQLLASLADLSPKRNFYPKNFRTMHTADFHKILPLLSQRDCFFGIVEKIISHNRKANFLFEKSVCLLHYSGDVGLLERSHRRTSKLFGNESIGGIKQAPEDLPYRSRDLVVSSAQGEAFSMASLIADGTTQFSVDRDIKSLIQGWQIVSGFNQDFTSLSLAALLSMPLKEYWASLLSFCRTGPSKFRLAFIFSLLTYGDQKISSQLRTLLAFAVSPFLQELPSPARNSYDLGKGHEVTEEEITSIISQCKRLSTTFEDDNTETEHQRRQILKSVVLSWPGPKVVLPEKSNLSRFNYGKLETLLTGRYAAWYRNHTFLSLCADYEKQLQEFQGSWVAPEIPVTELEPHVIEASHIIYQMPPSLLSVIKQTEVTDVDFNESCPSMLDHNLADLLQAQEHPNLVDANDMRVAWEELEDIVKELERDAAPIVQNYGKFVHRSLEACKAITSSEKTIKPPGHVFLQQKAVLVQTRIDYILRRTRELLKPQPTSDHGLEMARLWPSVSHPALLQLLSSKYRSHLPLAWKRVIVRYAEEITALQRVERMQNYVAANDKLALAKELENPAHAEWSTEERPDWLLLEIQNQILIRPVQVRVALEIIKEKSSVVLADMGIGKSSTILPMVVTALATGSSLVRVIVLKPLAIEMLRNLSRSLSGLVGRTVYFLPISRQTTLDYPHTCVLQGLYESCMQNSGVLVSLPEHLNSFRLLCNDKLYTDSMLAPKLFGIQNFLDQTARDVLDESDQLLEPGYELVYTTGELLPLSRSPQRWIVALELLDLVQHNAHQALEKAPFGLELEDRPIGAFDHIRILNDAGCESLMSSLVDAVVQGKLASVPLGHCNTELLQALRLFIQDVNVHPETLEQIKAHFKESGQLDILYVVRGLISYQVLAHALRKRWLVNYGLDRNRRGGCLAAVPYRAKAIPSQSSEFAQPEMMIILTGLSYYYTGLQFHDLQQCIRRMLKLTDPSKEFSKWVQRSKLPEVYQSAGSINLDDASCMSTLYEHLRLNKAAIEFFLKREVFPKVAREFTWKLSTSAWDLCADYGSGKVTTGFSGTCDSRIPWTVELGDIQALKHSTASTLATILRHDNREYICASSHGQRLTNEELLDLVVGHDKGLSVIIDVGAQFLEDNEMIASQWLSKCKHKLAAIFFNDVDEKMVVNRDGTTEKFNSSIFKESIGSCLLYLDEFHTRGTDFQLPDAFAAAVLLGPRIPKDTLVQACMRMRKLAVSQSVVFIAPPEVDKSIRAVTKSPSEAISSVHVVRWAIHQSCVDLQHQHAQCMTKGMLHSRRRLAAARHVSTSGHVKDIENYLKIIRERESRPVSEMYRVNVSSQKELPFKPSQVELDDEIMAGLLGEWDRTGIALSVDSGIFEEQEREILHEVEQIREVQRPIAVTPQKPEPCQALWKVIRDGVLPNGSSDELLPAFEVLTKTSLAPSYSQAAWPMHIQVTKDFTRTIVSKANCDQDNFLRPVQWVLYTKLIGQPIIISPHEAELFLPEIRKSKRASLFLYQARVSKGMPSFDKLDVYKIPEEDNGGTISRDQVAILNLFAGQLYFSNFEDYQLLCTLIGLWDGERELLVRRNVLTDNWVPPACRKANGWTECPFVESPVQTLKAFIGMRRMGNEWLETHMDHILSGRLLRRKDFEKQGENGSLSVANGDKNA